MICTFWDAVLMDKNDKLLCPRRLGHVELDGMVFQNAKKLPSHEFINFISYRNGHSQIGIMSINKRFI